MNGSYSFVFCVTSYSARLDMTNAVIFFFLYLAFPLFLYSNNFNTFVWFIKTIAFSYSSCCIVVLCFAFLLSRFARLNNSKVPPVLEVIECGEMGIAAVCADVWIFNFEKAYVVITAIKKDYIHGMSSNYRSNYVRLWFIIRF